MTNLIEKLKTFRAQYKENPAFLNLEPLMTTEDLEQLLRVDKRTLQRMWKRGELPMPLKVGGSNRWRPSEIADMLGRLGHRVGRKLEPLTSGKD